MRLPTPRFPVIPLATLFFVVAGAAQAAPADLPPDPAVTNLCKDLKRAAPICECAALRLKETTEPARFRDYAAVGAGYLRNKYKGQRRRAAWQAAVTEQAAHEGVGADTLFNQMSEASDAHLLTMQTCSQQ